MSEQVSLKKQAFSGIVWRFIENTSAYFISFVIQIILARILVPEDFGLIATASVIITIMNVFVQTGFSSALIQKKELSEVDCSSAFYVGLAFSALLYLILFFFSGFIADFYNEPKLKIIINLQSLSLITGALISVQTALIQRNMKFKLSFIKSIVSSALHGIIGITMALKGYGVMALVYSTLASNISMVIVLSIIVKWKPKPMFSLKSVKKMFGFSSKVLLTSLINTLRDNIRSLIIGKKYSAAMLGFYNRGYQIPSLIMTNANGAVNSVLLPTLSKVQDDREKVMQIYKRIMKISCFVSFPILFGLIAISDPMILVLYTEKWAVSIPYVRLTCVQFMILPFAMCLQVFLAIGRSDLVFKLSIYGFAISIASLLITYSYGVYWLVVGLLISEILFGLGEMIVLQKTMKYSVIRQFEDVWKSFVSSALMAAVVYAITLFKYSNILKLTFGVVIGAAVYIALQSLLKDETMKYCLNELNTLIGKKK